MSRTYRTGGGEVRAVDGVDVDIAPGEFVAVEGPSGSGKTTLLQLLGALDAPTSGSLRFDGRELAELNDAERTKLRRSDFGFVFQNFNLIPTLTAAENVEAALVTLNGDQRGARRPRAKELLEQVGLAHRLDHLPSRLSGGEQQRVAIARALANHPRVLLADEPTGNLDTATAEEVMRLLADLSATHGVTVVVVTHAEDVARLARRRLRMRDGGIVEGAAVKEGGAVKEGRPVKEGAAAKESRSVRERAPAPSVDRWGPCPDCGADAGVLEIREHCRCEDCGKRFVRKKTGERPWTDCPSCGRVRSALAESGACAACGVRRTSG